MTTLRHLRTSVRRLAHVEERKDETGWSWSVRGREFAAVVGAGSTEELRLHLDADDASKRSAEVPGSAVTSCEGQAVVVVAVADVNGMVANALLGAAHAHVLPSDLVPTEVPDEQVDLPAVGRPATRGLIAHGLTTLDAVSRCSRAEVAALHGVGPRALTILDEALAALGLDWA